MADRTWEDVAAGVERRCLHDAQNRPFIFHIAAALREAHEAGLRERIDVLDCDACGERHMTERGAEMASEDRELRRELAARRAVDGWLGESNSRYLEVGMLSGLFNAVERHRDVDGIVAAGATYPALAAALGLEVEDE
jgi:hypothetical protein